MTHPTQPPDPYGDQGGYGQDPYGNYPQYGQNPYGQYGQYPQHPYSQYAYGQYQPGDFAQPGSFGGPPPPPRKRRAGLWAGLSAGAALLIAFLITAFVAPGFLLSGKGPQEIARATAAAIDAHDKAALHRLTCTDASVTVGAAIGAVGNVRSAHLRSVRQPASDRAVAEIAVRAGGMRATVDATFVRENGEWCWQDVSLTRGIASAPQGGVPPAPSVRPTRPPMSAPAVPGGPGSTGELVDARKAIEEFVTAVNDGDKSAATELACEAQRSAIAREIHAVSSDGVRLELRPDSLVGAEGFVNATLYLGAEKSGSVTVERDAPSEKYCVSFFVYF